MIDEYDNETGIPLLDKLVESPLGAKLPRGYLSVSQITQFLKCGAAYEERYVKGTAVPANNYTIQGRAVHKSAEILHTSLIQDPKLATSVELMESVYSDTQDQEVSDNTEVQLIDESSWGNVKDEGIKLVRQYRKGALGELTDPDTGFPMLTVKPIAAERVVRVLLTPEEYDPIPFMGVIDLEEHDTVADLKNKKKASTQADADNSLQLTLYAHILGKPQVRLDQVVKPTKTYGARYLRKRSTRNNSEVKHALTVVKGVTDAIIAGNFMRTNPENWWCSSKWCPYWGSCRGKK